MCRILRGGGDVTGVCMERGDGMNGCVALHCGKGVYG